MKSPEAIRLNITIHPDKDPALFKLITSVSKESRTRRLISLAAIGIFAEHSTISMHSAPEELRNSVTLDDVQPVADGKSAEETQPVLNKQPKSNDITHEEGELEAISGLFA